MSYQYPITYIPQNPTVTIMGKRSYYQLEKSLPYNTYPNHPSKRPRTLTPGSATSAITQEEEEDHVNISPPLPYDSMPTCTQFNTFEYPGVSSCTFIDEPVASPIVPPTHNKSVATSTLRSDEDIQADIINSFTSGQAGTVGWRKSLLVEVLTNEIQDYISANDDRIDDIDAGEYQVFYSSDKQPFELDFYMKRLVEYVNCSTSVFVTLFVYLDRIQEKCKQLLVSDMNCHRLVFTCLVLAVKYLEDEVHSNAYYARVGGLKVDEMNSLEVKLLKVLDWNLTVTPETFAVYEEGMVQTANLMYLTMGSVGYNAAAE